MRLNFECLIENIFLIAVKCSLLFYGIQIYKCKITCLLGAEGESTTVSTSTLDTTTTKSE